MDRLKERAEELGFEAGRVGQNWRMELWGSAKLHSDELVLGGVPFGHP